MRLKDTHSISPAAQQWRWTWEKPFAIVTVTVKSQPEDLSAMKGFRQTSICATEQFFPPDVEGLDRRCQLCIRRSKATG